VELSNQHHCAFSSVVKSSDTASATGRMFLKIVGIFAEFERENLAERVRFGMERKVKEGYSLCGARQSYGYHRANGQKIQKVEDEQAAIVRRVFKLYLDESCSFTQIANILNAEHIVPKNGGKQWHYSVIKSMLSNPNYIGRVRYACKDEARYFEHDGQHEPIIDENTFYQVQEKIDRMRKITPTKHPSSAVYFCGVLYCAVCGGKLTTRQAYKESKNKTELRTPSYRCCGARSGACSATSLINHIKLERAFEQYIVQINAFGDFGHAQIDEPSCGGSIEITAITGELAQIEKKIKEIMSLFVANTIEFETYQGMVKLSNERRRELQVRLNRLQNVNTTQETGYSAKDIAANLRDNWHNLSNEQRQRFIQKFIKKMVVHSEPHDGGCFRDVIIDEVIFNEF